MTHLDIHADTDLPAFTFTFTAPACFTPAQEDQIVQWHRRRASFCLLTKELHEDGSPHYHSVIAAAAPKDTGSWTKAVVTLYKHMDIEYVPRVSCFVKKQTDRVGWFHYLMKEVTHDNPYLLLMGWRMSWIKKKMIDGVKKIPRKMLTKAVCVLNKSTSSVTVVKYASAASMPLTGKESFIQVWDAMEADNYVFGYCPKNVYREVMAIVGNTRISMECKRSFLFGEPS